MSARRIGIDLGGTKIEGIALHGGRVLARRRVATPGDYGSVIDAIVGVVTELEGALDGPASVGIGTPGAWEPERAVLKNSNTTFLNGRPLLHDLERRLARSVRIANDADCFALSEATDGAAAGAEVVFGAILGTGVGGGVVVRGRLLAGGNRMAGEWGHNPLPAAPEASGRHAEQPGPACYCGRRGCIETWLSGPGMVADHRRVTGEHLTAAQIAAAAGRQGPASATLERYCERLARALAGVINLLDPHVIVLGGGLGRIGMLYERIPQLWSRYTFSPAEGTRLLAPLHGDSSGVRGAAWLWPSGAA